MRTSFDIIRGQLCSWYVVVSKNGGGSWYNHGNQGRVLIWIIIFPTSKQPKQIASLLNIISLHGKQSVSLQADILASKSSKTNTISSHYWITLQAFLSWESKALINWLLYYNQECLRGIDLFPQLQKGPKAFIFFPIFLFKKRLQYIKPVHYRWTIVFWRCVTS